MGERLFYRESLFIISGHKKSGKSWAMAATTLDAARSGRPAVYLDLENGERLFAKRMALMGASADEIDERLHYIPFPKGLTLDTMGGHLDDIAEALPGAFVVVDSLRGLLTRLSPPGNPLNPNDHQAIEAVAAPFMEAVKTRGLTVGIIDHAKKTGSEDDEYSTAGAGAKEAAVDAVYFWTKVERYNRDTAGLVKLTATSDRDGELDFERYWKVGGQGEGQPFRFAPVDGDEVGTMGRVRGLVLEFLMDNEGEQFTPNAVVGADGVKGKADNIRKALDLLADGLAEVHRDPNPRRRDSQVYSYDPSRVDATGRSRTDWRAERRSQGLRPARSPARWRAS